MKPYIFVIAFLSSMGILLLGCNSSNQKPEKVIGADSTGNYLTNDGAWCWFSDPRAIYNGNQIISGWVKTDGTVEVASFDLSTKKIINHILYPKLQSDDHNNPAFVKTGDGNLLVAYTTHSGKDGFFVHKTTEGTDIKSFSDIQKIELLNNVELERFPKVHVTYANPYRLEAENNRLYCFGRWTGYKPNIMWSDDHGETWSKSRVFITNYPFDPNNRPYVKYYSDGQSKIHIIFTDGHPRVEPTNSVYYAYYENGAFFKANGTQIADMESIPFEPQDASVIFQSNEEEGRAWIADVAQDENGNPVVLYTKSPTITDHRYWYGIYDGEKWINHEICKSGKWFPQTPKGKEERETHYFGNMSLNPSNPSVVYLSRQVEGTFEIERWETSDMGENWSSQSITQNSEYDQVRPYSPRGENHGKEAVLWMENRKYVHYTDYEVGIRYHVWNH